MSVSNLDRVFLEGAMTGFSTILMPISAFSWATSNSSATIGDSIRVPHITNASGSSVFSYATGYTGDGNQVTGKDVVLGTCLYQKTDVDDSAMSKLSPEALTRLGEQMGKALARDVISASLACVVSDANFPVSASITNNQLTSSIGIAELVQQADDLNWTSNRSMILNSESWNYLLRNTDIGQAFSYGSAEPIQGGKVPSVMGFVPSKYTGVMPKADLKGIVCDPSAVIVGMGVHIPSVESKNIVATQVIESPEGLILLQKRWYDPDKATTRMTIECLFGCEVGNSTGLVQLK